MIIADSMTPDSCIYSEFPELYAIITELEAYSSCTVIPSDPNSLIYGGNIPCDNNYPVISLIDTAVMLIRRSLKNIPSSFIHQMMRKYR